MNVSGKNCWYLVFVLDFSTDHNTISSVYKYNDIVISRSPSRRTIIHISVISRARILCLTNFIVKLLKHDFPTSNDAPLLFTIHVYRNVIRMKSSDGYANNKFNDIEKFRSDNFACRLVENKKI